LLPHRPDERDAELLSQRRRQLGYSRYEGTEAAFRVDGASAVELPVDEAHVYVAGHGVDVTQQPHAQATRAPTTDGVAHSVDVGVVAALTHGLHQVLSYDLFAAGWAGDADGARQQRHWIEVAQDAPSTSANMPTASSTSASVITSGGRSLMTLDPPEIVNSPACRSAPMTGAAFSLSSMPIIRPRPRTSRILSLSSAVRPATSRAPRVTAFAIRPRASISSSTARPAAAASGLPPKVVPCPPLGMLLATSSVMSVAPMGTPPARPFAKVTMSAETPEVSLARNVPVRPTPDWISSKISSAPVELVTSRASRKYSSLAGLMPLSPWMGSSSTAATSCVTARRSSSTSLSVTNSTSTVCGAYGSR